MTTVLQTAAVRSVTSMPYYDKLRVIHQKNQGVSATRNTGIRLASGDLILFLDSDDTIEPSMVSTMVADIEKRAG